MNLLVKDRETDHLMQLPLPVKQVIAGQLDEQGYLPVGVEACGLQLVIEVLLNTGMKISQFNSVAKLVNAMSKPEKEKFAMAVVAFFPLFAGYPESYVILAQASSSVFTYGDCNSFEDLGKSIDIGLSENVEMFRAGLKYASENIVGFYGGMAVVLRNEDYDRAEEELLHDSDDCSDIETK